MEKNCQELNLRKVAMIGCGFVGSASAFALMQSGLFSEMVLIDADMDRADGEAMDIRHGLPFERPMKIYAGDYDDIVDAAIIIITAGANQKTDETRLDLVHKNVAILRNIIPEISKQKSHDCPFSTFDNRIYPQYVIPVPPDQLRFLSAFQELLLPKRPQKASWHAPAASRGINSDVRRSFPLHTFGTAPDADSRPVPKFRKNP